MVYPAPPSSAIAATRPIKNLYIIIVFATILYNLRDTLKFLIIKKVVNCLSNLFDAKKAVGLHIAPDKYFSDFVSILNGVSNVVIVKYIDTLHSALALARAPKHDEDVAISYIDVNNYKQMKHIIKAVSITIFTNFNVLVADVIIPKYFSRDVYYEIVCTNDSEMLFGDFGFGKIASSSYGIIKSTSLGLTLVVV